MSSKLSFRARALDATKALPIYHAEDIPDLADFAAINRTVPQMPTGMEKEEENEKHLVMAITTQQRQGQTGDTIIPTPNVITDTSHYDQVYHRDALRSVQYIRMSGLCIEEEPPSYDMDTEDEEWLNAQSRDRPLSPQHFEAMMDKLEQGSGNTVLSEPEAQGLLKDNPDLVLAVYDYWLSKRLRAGGALIPAIKQEKKDGTYTSNPYIAFRKRTEKMQTRKNRKNDELAYMQMVKLRRDLVRACSLAQLVKDREETKKSISQAAKDIFIKRYDLSDWSGSILAQCAHESLRVASGLASRSVAPAKQAADWDSTQEMMDEDSSHIDRLTSYKKKRYTKKKYGYHRESTNVAVDETSQDLFQDRDSSYDREDDEPDGVFTFRRRQHVKYCSPHAKLRYLPWEGCDEDAECTPYAKRYRFCRTTLSGSNIGLARRRVGRGGRVTWDYVTYNNSNRTASGASSDEEINSEVKTGDPATATNKKYLHFASRSPSPSSHPNPLLPHIGSQPAMPSAAGCFSNLPTSQFSLKAVPQLGYSDCKMHSATVTVTTCTSSLNSTSASVSSSHVGGAGNSGTCLLTPVDVKSHSSSYGAVMQIDHSRMGSHAPRTDDHLSGASMTAMSTSLLTQHRSEQNHCHDNTNVLTMTGPSANILRLNFPIKTLTSSNSIHTPFVPPRVNSSEFPNLERTKISNSQPYLDNHHGFCNSVMDSSHVADKPVESATRNIFDDPRQLKLATAAGSAPTGGCYNHTNFSTNPSLVSRGEVT